MDTSSTDPLSDSSQPANVPALEAAMKTIKDALTTKSGSKPVMDVLNKFLETMVTKEDNSDLQYCLVVNDKKSGTSSVIGTPDIARKAGLRKHQAAKSEEVALCDHDYDVEKPNKMSSPAAAMGDCEVLTWNDTVMKFAKPTKEVFFSPAIISDEEKKIHADFFDKKKKSGKTPEKYLKIRNHLIQTWLKQKPKYRSKSHGNRGLKDCGDVASIKRIHTYLECKGVINFNAVYYKTKRPANSPPASEAVQHKHRKTVQSTSCCKIEESNSNNVESSGDCNKTEFPAKGKTNGLNMSETANTNVVNTSNEPVKNSDDVQTGRCSRKRKWNGDIDMCSDSKTNAASQVSSQVDMQKTDEPFSGHRTRHIITPNWADILSGRKSIKKDGAIRKGCKSQAEERAKARSKVTEIESTPKAKSRSTESRVFKKKSRNTEIQVFKKVKSKAMNDKIKTVQKNSGACVDEIDISSEEDKIYPEMKPEIKLEIKIDGTSADDREEIRTEEQDETEDEKQKSSYRGPTKRVVKKEPDDIGSIELTGEGNIVRVRSGKNRHVPYELMILEHAGTTCADDQSVRDEAGETECISPDKQNGSRSNSRITYKFACTDCDRRFLLESLLGEHMEKVHNKPALLEDESKVKLGQDVLDEGDEDDDFADNFIDLCDQDDTSDVEYIDKTEQAKPNKKMKVKDLKPLDEPSATLIGEKPRCKICGTEFLYEANLKRHQLLHTDKIYECPFCAKMMKRKDYVIAHVRKIHKEVDIKNNPINFDNFTHDVNDINKDEIVMEIGQTEETNEAVDGIKHDSDGKSDKTIVTGYGKKVCPECTKIFDTHQDLEQHMMIVHEKDLRYSAYTCQACKKQFKTLVSYQVHKLSHRKKDHVCPYCDKKFSINSQLQVHKRHDHNIQYGTLMYFGFLVNNGKITCEICSTEFESMSEYVDHRPEHVTFKYLCRDCGNGFMNEDDLIKHANSGCSEQNLHLACGVCQAKFSMYDTRRKHVLSCHQKTTEFFCHHCGMCFDDSETLRTHFSSHKAERIFVCESCDKQFFEKRNLLDHRDLHKGQKNFACHICNRLYISSKSLQRHIKLHLSKGKYPCKLCDNRFASKDEFDRHMAQMHKNEENGISEHSCSICSKEFLNMDRLMKHLQVHSGDEMLTVYHCQHCSQMFDPSQMPLWKHMKAEHPEELKKKKDRQELFCVTCGFKTLHKQRMQRHLETHNATRNFACNYCLKKFQTTSSFLTHMIIHRGKIKKGAKPQPLCTWPGCHKQFMKHSIYKKHLMSHVFKVKVGKDICDCGKCIYSTMPSNCTFFLDDGNLDLSAVGYIDSEGKAQLATKFPTVKAKKLNVLLNNADGGVHGYESMEVLQEAIAQIEDIEKNTGEHSLASSSNVILVNRTDTTEPESDAARTVSSAAEEGEVNNSDICLNSTDTKTTPTDTTDGEFPANNGDSDILQLADETAVSTVNGSPQTAEAGTQVQNANDMDIDQQFWFECGVCDLIFTTKCQSLQHLEECHIDHKFPACEVCGKCMLDKKNLNDHKVIHDPIKRYKCPTCGRAFHTKQSLKQHEFIHAEDKPFKCEYCGHGFTQRGFFQEHVRRHRGVKPFKCVICSKTFVSKNLLKIHMFSHSGDRPYKCEMCPKAFSENYHLTAHIRTHRNERPFDCSYCAKGFFMKQKLIRHMVTVHNLAKESLSNSVATKVGEGMGYRDRTKLKNYKEPERKTQFVFIDTLGNIVSQEMKDEDVLTEEEEREKLLKIQQLRRHIQIKPHPQSVVIHQTNVETDSVPETFEVVTRRDEHGHIQVTSVEPQSDHQIIVQDNNIDGMCSVSEAQDHVIYHEIDEPCVENDGNVELHSQNYTLVTQSNGHGHLQSFTQALAGVHCSGETDGEIQVITQINDENMQADDVEDLHVITEDGDVEGVAEKETQNFRICIGEDGTVDAADFEKIEALRNLYNNQPIVIVLESPADVEDME